MQTVTNAPGSSVPGCEETADGCFIPSPVTIDIGATVTWENNDTAAHTSTAGSAVDGPSGVFDSSLIMAGSSFSHTFDSAGTYDYFCMVHPWMSGTVIVEDFAAAAADAAAADAAAADAAAEAAAAEAAAAEAAEAAAEAAAADAAEAAAAESMAALEAAAAESLAAAEAAAEAAAAMAAPAIDAADYISASGASITSITANADDDSVIIVIDAVDDGELNVILSDKVIKAFDDGSYFVLVNNEEVEFSQTGNNLTIPYEAGNDTIEIVGSYAIPEFGTIAMIVLAVAIVSIIVITTKTRTSLIPKL
jgi:predicted secreted protein with PEFG-CTERM motif